MYDKQVGQLNGDETSYNLSSKIYKYEETVHLNKMIGGVHKIIPHQVVTAVIVPDTSTTQFTRFMMAFNPENHELVDPLSFVAIISYPILKPARIFYFTRNNSINHDHFFKIATVDIDEMIISKLKNEQNIKIEIVPYSEEQNYNV